MGDGELPWSVTPERLQLLAPIESIAQRSRRSQRGILGAMVRAGFGWSSSLLGEKPAFRREHRTEVTEATERGADSPQRIFR